MLVYSVRMSRRTTAFPIQATPKTVSKMEPGDPAGDRRALTRLSRRKWKEKGLLGDENSANKVHLHIQNSIGWKAAEPMSSRPNSCFEGGILDTALVDLSTHYVICFMTQSVWLPPDLVRAVRSDVSAF